LQFVAKVAAIIVFQQQSLLSSHPSKIPRQRTWHLAKNVLLQKKTYLSVNLQREVFVPVEIASRFSPQVKLMIFPNYSTLVSVY